MVNGFSIFQETWSRFIDLLAFDPALLRETEMVIRLCLQAVFIMGAAFFSSSEAAMFSLSRLDLQKIRRERHPRSEILHALLDQPRRLIISILCGNELLQIASAANAAGIFMKLYGPGMAGVMTFVIMVPLMLLIGEATPKTIAVSNPVRISTGLIAAPLNFWTKLITPVRNLIRIISDRITTLIVGEEKAADNILHLDEFRSLVEEVAREGQLDATERALIHNLLDANDTEIVEIMTPRTRAFFLESSMKVPEMIEEFKKKQHSRVPVYQQRIDNLVGFLHAEDILVLVLDQTDLEQLRSEDIMRPPVVVPLTKRVDEMFDFFQDHNVRAAVCLNEFGGVEGFITINDVLSFIFGRIAEDIQGQEYYRERDEDLYELPGEMKLTDFNNLTNFGLEDPRMTTIGGVAFRYLDRLPRAGDRVTVEGIEITVLEMDGHRIARVRVSRGGSKEMLEQLSETETL
ncbi:MAG: hemolysin family protein [Desulfohalobiaceae bacterium]|nr:hemolysin family protein [Desulfohalobiaceae bacterium]